MVKNFTLIFSLLTFLTSCSSSKLNKNTVVGTNEEKYQDEIAKLLIQQGEVTPVNQYFESGLKTNRHFYTPDRLKKRSKNYSRHINLIRSFKIRKGNDKLVKKWVEHYTKHDKERFQRMINRAQKYKDVVQRILTDRGLPPELFFLAFIESGFVTSASSSASAKGVWQFMKGTGKQFGLLVTPIVDERSDPIRSTYAAAKYLRKLYSAYESWELAFAAYNAGEYRILSSIMKGETRDYWKLSKLKLIPRETRNYVPKIIAAIKIYKNLKKYGFSIQTPRQEIVYPELELYTVSSPVRVKSIAKALGVRRNEVLKYNPHLQDGLTPIRRKEYGVWFPNINSYEKQRLLSKLRPEHKNSKRIAKSIPQGIYKVKRGDTLIGVSKKLSTSIPELRKFNNIRGSNLFAGQRLKFITPPRKRFPRHYSVRSGDTLSKISERFNIKISNLKRFNNLKGNKIKIGQRIYLSSKESSNVHIVKSGENLTLIARKYGVDIRVIKRKNRLKNSQIYPGQRLNI